MSEPAERCVYACDARAAGGGDQATDGRGGDAYRRVMVRAGSGREAIESLAMRGIEARPGSCAAVLDQNRLPDRTVVPTPEAQLRDIAPGPVVCDWCGASLDGAALDASRPACASCGKQTELIRYREDPGRSVFEQAHGAGRVTACDRCGYVLRGQRIDGGAVTCPECGIGVILMSRRRAIGEWAAEPLVDGSEEDAGDLYAVRCTRCAYPLAGVPIVVNSADRASVTCPECGTTNALSILTDRQVGRLEQREPVFGGHDPMARYERCATAVLVLILLAPLTLFLLWFVTLPMTGVIMVRRRDLGIGLIAFHLLVGLVAILIF